LFEVTLDVSGAARLGLRRHAAQTLILSYHNIVPDGKPIRGDLSLHLPQRNFAAQLDILRRTHDIVPLTAVGEAARGRRPRAVITFDDAYEGALTAGVEELERRQLPATFFVAPAFVGGRSFWWDTFSDPRAGAPAPDMRSYALRELAGLDRRVRDWAAVSGIAEQPVEQHQLCASEEHIQRAAAVGMTFGSHTWSHAYLPALHGDALRDELQRPRHWLTRVATSLDWLSYPYGGYDASVAAATRDAGYQGALRVEGGWVPRSIDAGSRYTIPRYNVPANLSGRRFSLSTAGVAP
jgi:peptidoglycan/xylan/chitin deacetylase (PgdA/CDA1 family)